MGCAGLLHPSAGSGRPTADIGVLILFVVRPALDSHRRSAQVLTQSPGKLMTTAPPIASHGVFSGQLATHVVGYEFRRCDTAANSRRPAPRLGIHADYLRAGITIEYFTGFVRLPNEPDTIRERGNQRPRQFHGLGIPRPRQTPPAVAEQRRRMPAHAAGVGAAGSLTCAHACHWTRRRRRLPQPRFRDHARPPSRHRHVDRTTASRAADRTLSDPATWLCQRTARRRQRNRQLAPRRRLPGTDRKST